MQLSYSKRKKLKAIAHSLRPIVQIGKKGLTEEVVNVLDIALTDHELIKVQFVDFKVEKKAIVGEIIEQTGAELIEIIGHRAIFYRENPEKDEHVI